MFCFRIVSTIKIALLLLLLNIVWSPLLCCNGWSFSHVGRFSKVVVHSIQPRQSGYDTSAEYERFLFADKKKKNNNKKKNSSSSSSAPLNEVDEDGYASMMRDNERRPLWKKALLLPLNAIVRRAIPTRIEEPGTLILIRHGESEWNKNKTFTGWADPDLSQQGYREVEYAARLIIAGGYNIDVVFTSRLKRAIRSSWILLGEMNQLFLPVFKSWRLNERNYGGLTGLCKIETAQNLGVELVQSWRGSLRSRPPPIQPSSIYWPGRDRRYSDLLPTQIPYTESLLDCMERTRPLWEDKISYELRMGRNVMVVAHANTLRGLVKIIDNIGDEDIQQVSIPTGIPIVYKFEKPTSSHTPSSELVPIISTNTDQHTQTYISGIFLGKPGVLKEALKREKEWIENVPGYSQSMNRNKTPMSPLELSLTKLAAEKELANWAGQFIDQNQMLLEDDGSDGGSMGNPQTSVLDYNNNTATNDDDPDDAGKSKDVQQHMNIEENSSVVKMLIQYDDEEDENRTIFIATPTPNMISIDNLCLVPTTEQSSSSISSSSSSTVSSPIRRDATIVLIRHGKTEHNKLGLFTGWQDAPLAKEGREEAIRAGQLLKTHGFEFDVVYTSWLSRAIETAWLVMDNMDCIWLPLVKTWRLNERMYGALTGYSKQMIAQKYGEKQFKAWRRGFNVRPPKVSSFSLDYPGNDVRYKYLYDLRYSISESIMRSFDSGKLILHRKLPKTESLKDCMSRVIPYYTGQIQPRVNEGKRVLISSSENAIRGLLMHLCEIPEENISELEIPNGLPLIYDVKSKCIKLLDDGSGKNPLEVYNFGKAASFLFRPCQNEDGSEDEECDIRYMSSAMWNSLSEQEGELPAKMLRPNATSESEALTW